MKDTRFIELINLYIDRQITPDESAELEAEIQANPRRRQVYHQYCRMHRATKLVYESFRANSDQPAGNRPQPGTIARIGRQQRSHWMYVAGGLAAAACVAFLLLRNLASPQTAGSTIAQSAPQPTSIVAVAPVTTVTPVRFSALTREEPDYAAMLATLRQEEQRTYANGQTVRGTSLFDDGVFDGKQLLPLNARRNTPVRKTDSRTNAEFAAFQFQR